MTDAEHDAEQHRLRRTTRHLILSLAAVAVFAVAFAGIYVWSSNKDEPTPQPTATASPSPTVPPVTPNRETLLLQATTDAGAVGNLLTGLPPDLPQATRTATLMPLRSDLIVSAPGVGPEPLLESVGGLNGQQSAATVAATVGLRVDVSWRMDRKALAGLVDSVGGLPITIQTPLRIRDEAGDVVLRLRAGRQRLSGTDASWYALGSVRGQSVPVATDRFEAVILPTIERLPTNDIDIREALTALGALAPSSIGAQELADYLLELSTSMREDRATTLDLPVSELAFAGASVSWLDYAGATPRLRRSVPYALWQAGVDGPARVLVTGPDGEAEAISAARQALTEADLVFVDGRGTPAQPQRRTTILGRGDPLLTRQVAQTLGTADAQMDLVPAQPLRGQPWADVDVVLGTSFTPSPTPAP